jgi:Predicted nucleotide-binding protein containing TIR -like domain
MDYYHVIIEKKPEGKNDKPFSIYLYDLQKADLVQSIIKPYEEKKPFIADGYNLSSDSINRLKIIKTDSSMDDVYGRVCDSYSTSGIAFLCGRDSVLRGSGYGMIDVTLDLINEVKETMAKNQEIKNTIASSDSSKYVFVVHGHNEGRLAEVENFIRTLGFEPIVLFKEADAGQTIIEKIESYSSKACYAIVLYTKCDVGYLGDHKDEAKPRARQNVVFEHGYLMAKLGRKRICALVDGDDIETPSDINGILYQKFDSEGMWRYRIAKNMTAGGISVDMNSIK